MNRLIYILHRLLLTLGIQPAWLTRDGVEDLPMREGLTLSGIIHVLAFFLIFGGIPSMKRLADISAATPVPVEVVDISDLPNLPQLRRTARPQETQAQRFAAPPPERPKPKVEKTLKQETIVPPAAPNQVIEQAKIEKVDVAQEELKPVEPTKVEPPKDLTYDFSTVLKTVEKLQDNAPAEKPQDESVAQNYDASRPLSMSVIQAIQRTVERCWNIPAGARDAEDLVVELEMMLNPDGTVRAANIVDQGRMRRDPFYRVAAESAVRAVYNPNCNPLPIPLDEYEKWKVMTLRFNPKEMLGY